MEKLKALLNQYFRLVILIGLLALAAVAFWVDGKYHEKKFNDAIQTNQAAAAASASESANAEKQAANSEVERRTEDAVRERAIKPKLDAARKQSAGSASSLETARRKYENEKTSVQNLDSDNSDNCVRLKKLFPSVEFEDCR